MIINFCEEEPSASAFGQKGDELSLMTLSQYSPALIRVHIILTPTIAKYRVYRNVRFRSLAGQNLC